MNLIQELRQRRVPQIVGSYVVGSWGALQFLAFLESRMTVSPHLVNLVGLALLLLLPSVVTLAWVHGRPGKDAWGRAPKLVVPANVVAVGVLLVFLFQGRDLGAVTETIAVEDENGAVSERVVPKSEYRRRVLVFYPENGGAADDDWAREVFAFLIGLDVGQDPFVDVRIPLSMPNSFREAGSDDGHGLTRAAQRKLARDAHLSHFLTATLTRTSDGWRLDSELNESESGKVQATSTLEAASLLALTDLASVQLRRDLGIPAGHIDENPDLPVAEATSSEISAVANHVRGLIKVTHGNDWEGALAPLEAAVATDPDFALAQFLLFGVRQTLGDAAGASTAIAAAMENLYRVPERVGFVVKAQYYFNEKQDADKALAVLRMWSQIYPNDIGAYEQQATFYIMRQDLAGAVAAYEQILAIDPSRVEFLDNLADLNTQLGDFDAAEGYLQRYIDYFPTRADGYEELSDFYSKIGRLAEARDALAKAQLLEPGNTDLALSLVDLDVKAGLYAESDAELQSLLAKEETDRSKMRVLARQANLAGLRGQPDVVIERLARFYATGQASMNPLQINIVYSLMLPAISMSGRPEVALDKLAEVRALIPEPYDQLAGVGQAWVYADMGRTAAARAELAAAETVVESFKFETFRSSLDLVGGMIAEADGDLGRAVELLQLANENAVQVEPMYRIRLIRALRESGLEKEAEATLNEATKVEPTHPGLQLEWALLRFGQDRPGDARDHLAVALAAWADAAPEFEPAREARQLAEQLKVP